MRARNRTKKEQWERPSRTITFSCAPEIAEYIATRVGELKPMVASRSHYFLRLVEADRTGESQVFPKDDAQALLPGIAA